VATTTTIHTTAKTRTTNKPNNVRYATQPTNNNQNIQNL